VVAVGSTSSPLTLTLNGVGPATLGGVLVSGPFEESDNCACNGQTWAVRVYFNPTGSGLLDQRAGAAVAAARSRRTPYAQ